MSFTVLAETYVAAPPEVVYRVIVDVERWREWSSWLAYEGGEVAVGSKLRLRLTPPHGTGYGFAPEVLALEPPAHFAWIGRTGVPGVFDGEHHFEIRPEGSGSRLVNRERYAGLLSPLFRMTPMMRSAPDGFAAMNDEIRRRAEALAAGG